jgi:nucleotide-binding universal stress UspA family protein
MKPATGKIEHILCPTDLSARSQATLNFAASIATRLSAKITACHFASTVRLSGGHGLAGKKVEIGQQMADVIKSGRNGSAPLFEVSVWDNSVDPAQDILTLSREAKVDLIVMKARRGVLSALHYGSIVERITRNSEVPVLLLPTRFVDSNSAADEIDFREVLFDYDFSDATDKLFPYAMSLTEGFKAGLHLLAILEPPDAESSEVKQASRSREMLQNVTLRRLESLAGTSVDSSLHAQAVVQWGRHAETILEYAEEKSIDLICTTLPRAYYYFDKLYCAYLGQLLQSAKCPILALRSV